MLPMLARTGLLDTTGDIYSNNFYQLHPDAVAGPARRPYIGWHTESEAIMTTESFFQQLDAGIAQFDLLCHPFYKAWSAGELSRNDLREYARDYYHQVRAFPTYLAELSMRLEEGELRRALLGNLADEKGGKDSANPEHAELWLDFAEGVGARREMRADESPAEVKQLIWFFHDVASDGTPEEALAAFYAYESQVPRVAKEKARGLRAMYGADERTCGYFTLHSTADVYHAQVWRQQLNARLQATPEAAEKALAAGQGAGKALWRALDGIEGRRTAKAA
jgi:pyrroloquinoline-quinone synthase